MIGVNWNIIVLCVPLLFMTIAMLVRMWKPSITEKDIGFNPLIQLLDNVLCLWVVLAFVWLYVFNEDYLNARAALYSLIALGWLWLTCFTIQTTVKFFQNKG